MINRKHFIPVVALAIIGVILGSFFDFQINSAIYDRTNWFGIFMAAFGEAPVYIFLGVLAFGFVKLAIKHYTKVWQRIILFFLALACIGVCIYYAGEHVFSVNAYNDSSKLWIGLIISSQLAALGFFLGYLLLKDSEVAPFELLKAMVFIIIVMGFATLVTQIIKISMCRPRFRFLSDYNELSNYKNWWESGKVLKENYSNNPLYPEVTSEEFKSFPSGHLSNTTTIICMLTSIPILNPKIKVKKEILFYAGAAWCVLLAYTRMRVGAHFLSDVSMGLLINIIGFLALDLIVYRKPKEKKELTNEM